MSHHADPRQTRNSNDQDSRNNANLIDAANYYDYSSMSALASAAGIQGQQTSNQYHGAEVQASNFADIDSHLGLYSDIQHTPAQTYHDFMNTGSMDGAHDVTAYSNPNHPINEWYPTQINNIPQYMEHFSQFQDPQSIASQVHTDHTAKSSRLISTQEINGDVTMGKQVVLDEQPSFLPKPEFEPTESEAIDDETKGLPKVTPMFEAVLGKTPDYPKVEQDPQHINIPDPGMAPDSSSFRTRADFRPRTSIPMDIPPETHAQQCILAAYASRLNPFALHLDEHKLLRTHINQIQVTAYLNIRNAILRLWNRNPLVSVSREEAAGCTKDSRWFDLAEVTYDWLVRSGYINFGCVEVPSPLNLVQPFIKQAEARRSRQKTIVIIGAGMAGLGCSRQLDGLFKQFANAWTAKGEIPPKIVILEGRKRVGGRIYSKLLARQNSANLPPGARSAAEMGAQIITGFDHGNPLSTIVRGQLALHYHPIRDNSILYDFDGTPVNKSQDALVEKLYNNILDRASVFRHKPLVPKATEGEKDLILLWKDPAGEGGRPISVMEDAVARIPVAGAGFDSYRNGSSFPAPGSAERIAVKAGLNSAPSPRGISPRPNQIDGWGAKNGTESKTINLDAIATASEHPSLGDAMDEAVRQYQEIMTITPQDMRLLNWHFANLEYANAVNLGELSLGSWDLDSGNEFEGEHSEITGGYSQVPYGIWTAPSKLDVRIDKAVSDITYHASALDQSTARIECDDGDVIEADRVVLTVPLGVLKAQSIRFNPALPDWKSRPIERLGFGTLNKVILVYEEPFWDVDRDMFGYLRQSQGGDSVDQNSYRTDRGKCYIFWNCVKTSGRPMLVAVMAGDAAFDAERTSDQAIVQDATHILRKIFSPQEVTEPSETIITRWSRDRFSRGSYSYVAAQAHADDYDAMAKPVGNLFFAGEATCASYPATVHGAYLSGLRAASEVLTSLIGPIKVPKPLIPAKAALETLAIDQAVGRKRKAQTAEARLQELRDRRNEAFEITLRKHIFSVIGEQPIKPGRTGVNPFLLYQKDHWHLCKAQQDAQRQQTTKDPNAKAQRNEVRAALGKMWREATEEERRPYLDITKDKKEQNETDSKEFSLKSQDWNQEAERLAKIFREAHPNRPSAEEERLQKEADTGLDSNKRGRGGE
ncbi:MAG: hypothetical protein M1814_002022 [Vezdaea aestivalis]|nr:MAG: hypothetical protein M1814_002022 [Vezdaea aestivalis]